MSNCGNQEGIRPHVATSNVLVHEFTSCAIFAHY
jgi:hypothetical protein